jgi:hypothetical protein
VARVAFSSRNRSSTILFNICKASGGAPFSPCQIELGGDHGELVNQRWSEAVRCPRLLRFELRLICS